MGADIVMCDPHRAIVTGPRRLRGERVESPDIRAGMAMLLAALCAEGRTEIGNIRQIDRGYERIDERLRELGARIERVATEPVPLPRLARTGAVSTPDDPPDPQRHARRAARRDARAARDHRRAARRLRAPRLRRGLHARARVRGRAARAAATGVAARPTASSTSTAHVLALRSDMTVPIARVVATRYAHAEPPLRFCYFAHAYRGVRPHRGQLREFLQAGIELIGAPAPDGTAEALTRAVPRARRRRAARLPRSALGDASLYPALLASLDVPEEARERAARTRSSRATSSALEREVAELGAAGDGRELLLRVPQRRGGPEVLDDGRAGGEAVDGPARRARRCSTPTVAERVIFDLGLVARPRLLHGRGVRGLRPGARRADRRRRALRRAARALRPRRCPRSASRCGVDRAAPGAGRRGATSAREPRTALTIAVPRGALFDGTLDLLDALGIDTAEVRANDRKLLFEDVGIVTMRPSDVPTYVEAGAADLGITGKDVLAEQAERDVYELLDLGYGPLHDGAGHARRARTRPREALRRLGVDARRDQVPADRRALLRGDRPPGRDRRGQGLGRARAADRDGRGDRRPHRDRHDAARERPRRPRGDRRVARRG